MFILSRRWLAGALALLLGCAGEPRAGTFVSMYDNGFNTPVTRGPVGARVIFMNVGGNLHNAVASDSSWTTPVEIKPGGEHTVVFDQAGVFSYYCTFHGTRDGAGMAGVVVVGLFGKTVPKSFERSAGWSRAPSWDPSPAPSGSPSSRARSG